ncbi:GDNF family receptor alpha-4 isoform 5 [Mus musculus]|uniref:GDNF family receptor alpha-4 isoform 5 n=1 Tax=Mus musculus TaxID=10090 RepID=UPI00201EAF12|nr:GDNF family receptor alpha-4 isoform 5 [Mus musculus]
MSVAQSKLPGPWVLFTSHHVWCGRWTVCTCHDGAIQAFDSLQPSVLQDQTAGCCFPRARHEWPEKSWRQKQSLFCPNAQGVLAVCTHCPGSPGPALIRNMNRGRHS